MSITKKIILWALVALSLVMAYISAYLPLSKSRGYIRAVQEAQNVRSIEDFKIIFDRVFNLPSPVGGEEVVKFLSNDIGTLLNNPQANEPVSKALVEYIEPHFFDNNVRHMITAARMYETLWRRYGKEEYFTKSALYYDRARAIGPKLPPVLYGMLGLHYAHQNFDIVKSIAEEILIYWPDDERINQFLTLPTITIIE